MTKLVGYRKFTSKKNAKSYCVANVVQDASDREVSSGLVGQKVEELFLPEEQYNYLKPADIGKNLELDYELSGGRAYLVSITVK